MKPRVDTATLKQLLSEHGSLEKAVKAKRQEKRTLERDIGQLQAEKARLEAKRCLRCDLEG